MQQLLQLSRTFVVVDLLPCPMCGSSDLLEEDRGVIELYGHTTQDGWIECENCGYSSPVVEIIDDDSYDLVREKWNTLADEPLSKF